MSDICIISDGLYIDFVTCIAKKENVIDEDQISIIIFSTKILILIKFVEVICKRNSRILWYF